jgi:hypothetical protein
MRVVLQCRFLKYAAYGACAHAAAIEHAHTTHTNQHKPHQSNRHAGSLLQCCFFGFCPGFLFLWMLVEEFAPFGSSNFM